VAAAFRAVRAEPTVDVVALQGEVRRLTERLERLEHKVDISHERSEEPLSWPAAVDGESRLEVPPLSVSRRPSPAFDALLGPAPTRSSAKVS
jgi:Holliday junction resolvase